MQTTTELIPLYGADNARVGDWISGVLIGSDRHGPVAAIEPYRCSPKHGCDRKLCPRSAWKTLVFQDRTEVTLSGHWPEVTVTRAVPTGPRPDVVLPEGWTWSARRPGHHGSIEIGPPQRVAGDRRVLGIPGRSWAHTPEGCRDDTGTGEWVLPEVLVCRGCGLDST